MNARQARASKIQKKIREIITDFPGSLVQFIFVAVYALRQ